MHGSIVNTSQLQHVFGKFERSDLLVFLFVTLVSVLHLELSNIEAAQRRGNITSSANANCAGMQLGIEALVHPHASLPES